MLLSSDFKWSFSEPIVYCTLAFLGLLLIIGIVFSFVNRKKIAIFIRYALLGLLFYSLIAGCIMLIREIISHYGANGDYANSKTATLVFIPLLVTLLLVFITSVCAFMLSKFKPSMLKKFMRMAGGICIISLLVTLVLIAVYFSNNIVGDGYYTDGYGNLNSTMLYVSVTILVVSAIVVAFVVDKDKSPFDTKTIAFAGICVALSFALSYVKFVKLPQGGSVTLASALPIMLFAYVYGVKKGLLIGLIYGLLQAVQDPYIVHPAQFLLDYPIAFAMTGFAGSLKYLHKLDKLPQVKFALSAIIGGVLRFIAHTLSGIFAFGAYAKDSGANNVLLYSLVYNSFVFVDLILVIIVGVILFSSKSFTIEMNKFSFANNATTSDASNSPIDSNTNGTTQHKEK